MKASMKRVTGAFAFAATIASAQLATAGKKAVHEVAVTPSERGSGSMGDARGSSDSNQTIRVRISGYATYEVGFVSFTSSNAGVSGQCTSTTPWIVDAMRATKSDSFIQATWNSDGQCTSFVAWNSSEYTVKEQ
jgi:hypothetical protein